MAERMAYVSNLMSGTVSVIDPVSRELKRTIRVGNYPVFSLAYAPDMDKIVVTLHNYERKNRGGRLLLVDPSGGKIIRTIPYPGIAVPSGMIYDTDRDLLYVADENLNCVWIHDGRTLELTASLPAGMAPAHLAVSGDGSRLVVANRKSADLYVYDLGRISSEAGDCLFSAIPLGGTSVTSHPYDVKFPANSATCYVTDFNSGELLLADTVRNRITNRIKLRDKSFGMALESTGERAYVCNMGSGSVSVIGLDKKKKIGEIQSLGAPCHCAIDEKGRQLIVTDQGGPGAPGVHIIDLTNAKIMRTIRDRMIRSPVGVTLAG